MKYEIEVPYLPEGVKPVRYGVPDEFDYFFGSDCIVQGPSPFVWLIVKPKDGFKFTRNKYGIVDVRSIPRKRVRIELEWTPDLERHISSGEFWVSSPHAGAVGGLSQNNVTILEDSDEN